MKHGFRMPAEHGRLHGRHHSGLRDGEELVGDEIETLMRLLAKTKASARKAIGNGVPR